ncbi:MAG: hypothetical protein M0Z34_11150, partial [Nitrospiraceae bacterium]|nr:hypothetical protein [Nitrospiraceae bacterium]
RVSRLLQEAEELNIVRTVVTLPPGLHVSLEEKLERMYQVRTVYVVDATYDHEDELTVELGTAAASLLDLASPESRVIGFTSWSRSLREMVRVLQPARRSRVTHVVEMLGDVGPPAVQHAAAHSTQKLAELLGAQPSFLRVPGVVDSPATRDAVLGRDAHAKAALDLFNEIDLALVGIGTCEIVAPLRAGDNFFTEQQFQTALSQGAVGQVNLRFMDRFGQPVDSSLNDLVIGITLKQLLQADRRVGVAGGPSKYAAIRAALLGGWVNVLVTDLGTAERLLSDGDATSTNRSVVGPAASR